MVKESLRAVTWRQSRFLASTGLYWGRERCHRLEPFPECHPGLSANRSRCGLLSRCNIPDSGGAFWRRRLRISWRYPQPARFFRWGVRAAASASAFGARSAAVAVLCIGR